MAHVRWWAVLASALVLGSAAFATYPIRDAATYQPVSHVNLVRPVWYVVLAPFSDVFDTMSLMDVHQHMAIGVTLVVVFVVWRIWRAKTHHTTVWHEGRAAALALFGLVAVYAAAVLMPRPMAALAVESPLNSDVLLVDFHSHTNFSHDGAPWFDPAANRHWHRNAGYDVAYVTDHRTFEGAEAALKSNPPLAGEGTTLLQGLEAVWDGAHVNILGAGRMYLGLTEDSLRDVNATALALASLVPHREPVVIYTFPDLLQHLHVAAGPGTPGARAIEIVDGSPRGLGDTRRLRTTIATIADTMHLALVSGSDNHGWGYTAPAWTQMIIPGWRAMTPDSLAAAIDDAIRTRGFGATQVIERRVANTDRSSWRLAATLPLVSARMLTMLSENERIAWLLWIWGIAGMQLAIRRRANAARTSR